MSTVPLPDRKAALILEEDGWREDVFTSDQLRAYGDARAAAERERFRTAIRMKHDYMGNCPDEQQPESRDSTCAACRALMECEA